MRWLLSVSGHQRATTLRWGSDPLELIQWLNKRVTLKVARGGQVVRSPISVPQGLCLLTKGSLGSFDAVRPLPFRIPIGDQEKS
jgi:hypothetical protein